MSALGRTYTSILLVAFIVTLALTIPRWGLLIASGLLAASAMYYVRRLELASRVEEPASSDDERGWMKYRRPAVRILSRIALGVMLTVGLVAPFWMVDGTSDVEYQPKPLEGPALFVAAAVTWITLPLAIYLLTTRDAAGRLGPRWALLALWRKPWRALGALLAFPLTVVAAEALLAFGLWQTEWLPLFTADLMPMPEGFEVRNRVILDDGQVIPPEMTETLDLYRDGLRRGSTLTASIPLSLSRGLEPRILWISRRSRESYLLIRLVLSFALVAAAMIALSVQAAVLGRLPRPGPIEPADDDDEALSETSRDELPDGLIGDLRNVR